VSESADNLPRNSGRVSAGYDTPTTARHIKAALKLGATMEEIMEVLKLCVVQRLRACNLGVPTIAEEIAKLSTTAERVLVLQ